jgi:hypothetical protein
MLPNLNAKAFLMGSEERLIKKCLLKDYLSLLLLLLLLMQPPSDRWCLSQQLPMLQLMLLSKLMMQVQPLATILTASVTPVASQQDGTNRSRRSITMTCVETSA